MTPGPPRTPLLQSPQDPTTPVNLDTAPYGMEPPDPSSGTPGMSGTPVMSGTPGISGTPLSLSGNPASDLPGAPDLVSATNGPESIDGAVGSVEDDSAEAIQRIKDSMKEEVKKFETSDSSTYFNMH